MNKTLMWCGLVLQIIHVLSLLVLGLMMLDWGFLDAKMIFITGYVIFNVITLIMIFVGIVLDK